MLERKEEAVTRDVGRMSRAPEPALVTPEEEAVPPRSRGQALAGGNCGTHCCSGQSHKRVVRREGHCLPGEEL